MIKILFNEKINQKISFHTSTTKRKRDKILILLSTPVTKKKIHFSNELLSIVTKFKKNYYSRHYITKILFKNKHKSKQQNFSKHPPRQKSKKRKKESKK